MPGTDQHLTLQGRMIDLNRVDFVGRLETFDRDFAEVCERIGAPAVPSAPKNQTAPGGRDRQASDELRGWWPRCTGATTRSSATSRRPEPGG